MENRFQKYARSLGLHDPALISILDGNVGEDVVDALLRYMAEGDFEYFCSASCGEREREPRREYYHLKGERLK